VHVAMTSNAKSRLDALGLLVRFPQLRSESLEMLRSASWDSEADAAMLRLVLLAKSEPSAYLAELVRAGRLRDPRAPLQVDAIIETGDILRDRSTTRDILLLEETASAGPKQLRYSAMLGLRRLKDPGTVPFLVHELDSDDPEVQYLAVITLAEMTGRGGDFGSSMPLFEQDPAKYRQLWKQWWSTEGASRYK
jgi:hypothetical protein